MAISKEEVLALAQLARLSVTDTEAEKLGADISSILDYVSQVSSVEVSDEVSRPKLRNVMREDVLYTDPIPVSDKADAVRAAFPQEEKGYNVVRKIIEK